MVKAPVPRFEAAFTKIVPFWTLVPLSREALATTSCRVPPPDFVNVVNAEPDTAALSWSTLDPSAWIVALEPNATLLASVLVPEP